MSQALGTGDEKSVNVELNIIPFIDVMSCLASFLLVSAVWINIARIDVQPQGRARDGVECTDGCDDPKLSVLIDADAIWIGVSRIDELERIPNTASGYDWGRFEAALKLQKSSSLFADKTAIEIAAASTHAHPIQFQSLIAAMDVAVRAGFIDVGVTDRDGLSARPSL